MIATRLKTKTILWRHFGLWFYSFFSHV